MASLQALREVTVPVEIKRGNLTFTLNAALEKFTPEEGTYHALRIEAVSLQFQLNAQRAQLDAINAGIVDLAQFDQIRAVLEAPLVESEREKVIGDKALNAAARRAALKAIPAKVSAQINDQSIEAELERIIASREKEIEALRAEIDKTNQANHLNLAKRLAYLVVSSDIFDEHGKDVLSGAVDKSDEQIEADAQVFYKNFSIKLLLHALEKVEEAIYGPLETASSSGA